MATLATFDGALKTKFIGPIRDQIYSNKILLEGLRTRDASKKTNLPAGSREFRGIAATAEGIDYIGKTFVMPLHTQRNAGVGHRAEGALIPGAGAQSYATISDALKSIYGVFRVTGQLVKAAEKSEGAFERATASEMKRLADDVKRRVSIDGYTARDANGTSPAATINPGAAASATQTFSTTRYLSVGDYVDIYDPTGATRRTSSGALMVTAFDPTTRVVTLSAAVTTTTNDIVVFAAPNSTAAVANNDLTQTTNGLGNIVADTGVLHGINPATAGNGYWKSYVKDAASAAISDTLLRDVKDSIGYVSGMDDGTIGIWTRGIRNAYVNTLTSLKQFTDASATTLRGGFKAVLFDDQPMVVDDHCQNGTVYFIDTDAMFWAEMSDFEWADMDGKVLKWDAGYDAYIGYMFKYYNLGTWARNRHGKLINVADTAR